MLGLGQQRQTDPWGLLVGFSLVDQFQAKRLCLTKTKPWHLTLTSALEAHIHVHIPFSLVPECRCAHTQHGQTHVCVHTQTHTHTKCCGGDIVGFLVTDPLTFPPQHTAHILEPNSSYPPPSRLNPRTCNLTQDQA